MNYFLSILTPVKEGGKKMKIFMQNLLKVETFRWMRDVKWDNFFIMTNNLTHLQLFSRKHGQKNLSAKNNHKKGW